MENKVYSKNIFESGFESFELDDIFLKKIDSVVDKKNSKENRELSHDANNQNDKNNESKYCEFSLLLEDLNESQFIDQSDNRILSSKVENDSKNKITPLKGFISCLSPILYSKGSKKLNVSSSTPLKPDETEPKEKHKQQDENIFSDWNYSEADLFDDWGDDDNKNKEKSSLITFSQAMKIIEEAEEKQENNDTETESVDLLTGEVVRNVPGSNKDSSDCSVVVVKNSKPAAAHKLNFVPEEKQIGFSSDDEFDFLVQDILDNPKSCSLRGGVSDSEMQNESIVGVRRKKGKFYQVIESDSEEDSFKVSRKNKSKRQKTSDEKSAKEFIESEAEVSDEIGVSSDEDEVDGEYDKSFLDEDSYYTQNDSAEMTKKYLESVKTITRAGSFKIPAPKPFNPDSVFSQIPETNSDYEIDSFCVNEVDDVDAHSELSDLEVAEQYLEMNKKKRKKGQSRRWKY